MVQLSNKIYYAKGIIGVSGGPDSMCLLDCLLKANVNVIVAFVNYHKRDQSKLEEKMVKEYCLERNLICEVLDLKNVPVTSSFQSWARKMRYDFFFSLANKYECKNIYIAHHLDDDLETLLIQEQRKITPTYYGLPYSRVIKGFNILRPLLDTTKKEILEYVNYNKIPYYIDESNFSDTYLRNRIRKQLQTYSQGQKEDLLNYKLSTNLANSSLLETLDKLLVDAKFLPTNKYALVDYPELVNHFVYKQTNFHLSQLQLEELIKQLTNCSNFSYTYKNYVFNKYDDKFYIQKQTLSNNKPIELNLNQQVTFLNVTVGFNITDPSDTYELPVSYFPLLIRNYKLSDTLELKNGHKKLSKFFKDHKIPLVKRKEVVIICNKANKIIYIPALNYHYRTNEKDKVTISTKISI